MACTYIFGGKTYNESDLDLLYKNVRAYVNSTTKELETIDIEIQDDKASKIVAGTKTTILRTERQGKQIGLPVGQSAYITIGGTPFIITNRGLLDINEAGGQDAILNSEDIASVDNFVFDYSKNWFLGKGKLYVYDITSLPKSEQDPDPTQVPVSAPPVVPKQTIQEGLDVYKNALTEQEQKEFFEFGRSVLEKHGYNPFPQYVMASAGQMEWSPEIVVGKDGKDYKRQDNYNVEIISHKKRVKGNDGTGRWAYHYYMSNLDGSPITSIPSNIIAILEKITGQDMSDYDTVLINLYPIGRTLGWHVDVSEDYRNMNRDIISVSIGADADFHYANTPDNFISGTPTKEETPLNLKSGDVVSFGGKSRLISHTVKNVTGTTNLGTLNLSNSNVNQYFKGGLTLDNWRMNFTFRVAAPNNNKGKRFTASPQPSTQAPVSAQPQTILANDTPLNKRKIRLENLGYTFTEMAGTFEVDHVNLPFSLDAVTLEDAIKLAEADYNTNAQDDNLGISMEDIGPEVPISDSLFGKLLESIGIDIEALTGKIDDFVNNFNEPKYKALRDRLINSPYFDKSSITFLDVVNNPKLLKQNPNTIKAEPLENPVYEEKQIPYRGSTYTVYLQNGIPVKTDLKQSEEQSDEDYKNLNRAIIEFYKRVNLPKQLTIEDQLTAGKKENPVNDNSSKTLQDEQVTAYEVIQSWLDRDIPMTADEEENFYNHTFFLSGPGGSGKTYISEILLKDRNPAIAAPTHQATGVLSRNFPEVQAQTVQSLFGMQPVPRKDNEFYSLTLEEIRTYFTSDDEKTAAKAPSFFNAKDKPIFLIDEASMLGGHYELEKADINIWVEDESGKAKSVEKTVYIEPDLGTLLQKFTDLYYELNGVYPKVLLTGDIAQTPMVDTPKGAVSSILQNLKDKGNYFELLKIRRTDNKGIADLSMGIRNQIIGAVDSKDSKVKNETLLRILEVFKNTTFYSDEYEHTTVEGEFIDTFVKYYKTNIKEKQDPEYTQMINFNAENHPWTVKMNNLIRKSLFGEKAEKSLVEGEVIILTTPNIEASFVEAGTLTSLPLLKDTKAFITKLESSEKKYTYRSSKTSREISVVVPGFNLTANVYHPDKGEGNPIEVTLFVVDQSVRSVISESFQQFNENPEIYKVDFFGKGVTRRELYIFSSQFPYWSFGYIVNNYKIQGSAVKNPFVHMQNIYDAPAVKDYLHTAQFLYTGVSRTREKLFTYHPKLNFKSLPGTRPVECQ